MYRQQGTHTRPGPSARSLPPAWMEELEQRLFLSAVHKATPGFQFYRPNGIVAPAAQSSPSGLSPAAMRHAYGIDAISFGGIVGDGTGQTIAIVDAYHAPTIVADLTAFDAYWTAAGFPLQDPPSFTVVGQTGSSTLPGTDPAGPGNSWAIETSLDVQWAHVVAPNASILLVEANSPSFADLLTAVDTARNYPGVCVVSMSWSADEFRGETSYDYHFTTPAGHTGVTFVASTGDYGAYSYHTSSLTAEYPAASANVLAVGGTTLTTGAGGDWVTETGWGNGTSSGTLGGSGGGISKYVNKPSYQNGVVTQSTKRRCIPDIAMDADPNTGVPVFDSWDFGSSTPWNQFGGTSLSAPLWAGLISIVDQGRVLTGHTNLDGPTTLSTIYSLPSQNFHDITSGNNGYAAGPGYDLVTGRGSPVANLLVGGIVGPTGSAPTVATPASAAPSPATGTTTALSVLGADDGGEANLTYTWATTGTPPAAVNFSANGTNAAKNAIATFTKVGNYNFQVTITDAGGLSTTSSVSVTVSPTLTSIIVSPASVTLNEQQTQQFTATARDQFTAALASQPSFTWTKASGVGSISSSGLYTAPASTGVATVTATSGAVSGNASITVNNAVPTVSIAASASPSPATGTTTALSVLGADDGGEANLTYTWATVGTPPDPVNFSANGTNAAKNATATFTKVGSYSLRVTITDAGGLSTTSSVSVTVSPTLTSIIVSPASVTLNEQQTQQFTATARDQFTAALASQPSFTWTKASGVGSISSSGLYAAPAATGVATITASSGAVSGNAAITVNNAAPTVAIPASASPSPVTGTTTALSVLGADDGGEVNLTYIWATIGTPPDPVNFSTNGTNAAKNATATFTKVGNYSFQVTITDIGGLSTTSTVDVTVIQPLTTVTVNPLVTNDHSPALTGTVDSPTAIVHVTVGGTTWLAVNNGDGTWALPGGTISPGLATGLYDLQAVADDAYGNHAADATTNELIVYTIPGDLNLDDQVGPEDFGILKDNFGGPGGYFQGDVNGDGQIGPEDFGILKDHFGLRV